ncbi:MAG TPA: DUF3280 domain-containing protein [Methylocystis sp.]|nr:DUF3280 domain-containing protein [Methylocystis sp.]
MKKLLALCTVLAVTTGFMTAAAAASARLLVLDFELVDTSNEPIDRSAEHARRLVAVRGYVAKQIAAEKIYDVADDKPVRAKIDDVLAHQYLRSCNGCELSLAREAGAEFVLLGKFNKVSTLIGSMEMRIENTQTGGVVYARSFDYRGDTDEAWMRAAKFFVEELSKSGTH